LTIKLTSKGQKIFNEFILVSEADPETMADVLSYDLEDFTTGMAQIVKALNSARQK